MLTIVNGENEHRRDVDELKKTKLLKFKLRLLKKVNIMSTKSCYPQKGKVQCCRVVQGFYIM